MCNEIKEMVMIEEEITEKELLEKAYREYERDLDRLRNEILSKLITIRNDEKKDTYVKWLNQAIEFMKEVK